MVGLVKLGKIGEGCEANTEVKQDLTVLAHRNAYAMILRNADYNSRKSARRSTDRKYMLNLHELKCKSRGIKNLRGNKLFHGINQYRSHVKNPVKTGNAYCDRSIPSEVRRIANASAQTEICVRSLSILKPLESRRKTVVWQCQKEQSVMNRLNRLLCYVIADGCVAYHGKAHNCELNFEHGPSQDNYLKWKWQQVEKLGFTGNYSRFWRTVTNKWVQGKKYEICRVWFNQNRLFSAAYRIAYPGGVKTYTKRLINHDIVDSYAMAIWWMDDGSLAFNNQSASIAGVLNSCCDATEAALLQSFFSEKYGKHKITINRKRHLFNIRFAWDAYLDLMTDIAPYIHQDLFFKCSVLLDEERKPIIPTSAGQLMEHVTLARHKMLHELKMYSDTSSNGRKQ